MAASESNKLLSMPPAPGRLIFETDSFMTVPLLQLDKFVTYCTERELEVTAKRLNRFEKIGVFQPIARCIETAETTSKLDVANGPQSDWFDRGLLVDTCDLSADYAVPEVGDESSEAFYSIFQIDHLSVVLTEMTLRVDLDPHVGEEASAPDWNERADEWIEYATAIVDSWQTHVFRRALPILCQHIANRYYPQTQTNQRVYYPPPRGFPQGEWIFRKARNWDWFEYARSFDPGEVQTRFGLTPAILQHAYETLSGSACFCDPLENWANLVEFVAVDQKRRLKGKALRAQSFRDAANMLRRLYKDLYDQELPPIDEIYSTVLVYMPELEIREDVRHHLEFVVNQYDLNPQPKLVLFVEGESEIVLIKAIFANYFGLHPGISGIEIVNLRGVNNATGSGKVDRFQAIFRLIDYLHHHQTLTFLILDRENQAKTLKIAANRKKSIHGQNRMAMPANHIELWKVSLEFDNFSNTEIATAMTNLAGGRTIFRTADIKAVRKAQNPGKALSDLYKGRTGYGLKKPALADQLASILTDPNTRRIPSNRPLVKILIRVRQLAARNRFPKRQESWMMYQASEFFGGNK